MKTKGEKKFDELKNRYLKAFKESNGYEVKKVFYKYGFVHLTTNILGVSKYRVSNFEEMTEELEHRVLVKKEVSKSILPKT